MAEKLEALKKRLRMIYCVREASSVLSWDQETGMPAGAGEARSAQMSALSELSHDMLVAEETGRMIEEAAGEVADEASEDGHLVRRARREFQRETKLPSDLVAEHAAATSRAQMCWTRAKRTKDFALFEPELTKILDLTRRIADCYGYDEHPYDALLETYEPGLRTARLKPLFEAMRPKLVDLVQRIGERPKIDDAILRKHFPVPQQKEFIHRLAREVGYDFDHGRIDVAEHPFCISFSSLDVRITNAYDERFIGRSVFGCLHETGHALYEQGSPAEYLHGPLEGGCSMGIHESQSRLWENVVGRSRPYWNHYFPQLAQVFPEQLKGHGAEEFHRAINRVEPTFIRVESDEVTYNLHIMLRFELELAMLEGKLQPKDVPAAWNAAMKDYLGLTPPDDGMGCLQDVHWSIGLFGYFPTYTLGNLLAAQMWESIQRDVPGVDEQIGQGRFDGILGWLRQKVHRWGARLMPEELIREATGRDLEAEPFLRYLEGRFGGLYGLD